MQGLQRPLHYDQEVKPPLGVHNAMLDATSLPGLQMLPSHHEDEVERYIIGEDERGNPVMAKPVQTREVHASDQLQQHQHHQQQQQHQQQQHQQQQQQHQQHQQHQQQHQHSGKTFEYPDHHTAPRGGPMDGIGSGDAGEQDIVVLPREHDVIETIETGVMRSESVHENLMKRYRCRSCDITLV